MGIVYFAYGVASYAIFFATFLYLIGFLSNAVVPKSIDTGIVDPVGQALLVNVLLMSIFGVQHSIMARPWFKKAWTEIVPKPIERSTYTLLSSLALILLYWQWRPIDGYLWHFESQFVRGIFWALFLGGFGIVLVSTFMIDHFDLFGLRQVFLNLRKKEYTHHPFMTPGFYKFVRHPLYVGWFIAFWATPDMTISHLVFALGMSGYILAAIPHEERDLTTHFGEKYENYRKETPMLVPKRRRT